MANTARICTEVNCNRPATDRCRACRQALCDPHTIHVTDPQDGWISFCHGCRQREDREARERHGIWS